jgi:hypothetical protein
MDGIVLNCLFIIPLLFIPTWFLTFLGLRCDPPIWAQMFGMLLLWLSVFYIPASFDLKKYQVYAWLAAIPSRLGGATFFLGAVLLFGQPPGFLLGGSIFLLQFVILLKVRDVENPRLQTVKA